MSIVFNGSSQCAFRATAPSASSFLMAGWFRRDTDSGAEESWISVDDGTVFNRDHIRVNGSDQLQGSHGFTANGVNVSPATSTWYWVAFRYTGGTMTVRHCADGDVAWQSNQSTAALSDLTPSALTIGAQYGNATPSAWAPMTSALVRVYSGATLPTDTEVLAERLNTVPTVTTGLWANYPFATGDLGNDDSAGARDLTLTGTPTFSSAKPTDLTIGGGTATAVATGTILTRTPWRKEIQDGGLTIVLTLTGDTFVAAGATFDAARQAIIDGIDAGNATTNGWDEVVKATMPVTAVVRTSATVCTVTLPAFATYAPAAGQTITVTLPATALTLAAPIVCTPTIPTLRGPLLSVSGGTTNGSGVVAFTVSNDDPDATAGEFTKLLATSGTAVSRSSCRFT